MNEINMPLPPKPPGSRWTDSQWRAVAARGKNLLVAAAAGSGKTAVLVERLIRRICDEAEPVDVDRLLVATFTKAAAAEMRHRIGEALEEALFRSPESAHLRKQLALLNHASITTLHSFCIQVIRRYFHMIDLDPGFRIADDTEAALLRQEELEALLEEHYGEAPPEHPFWELAEWFGGDRSDAPLMELIERLYEFSRSHPFPEHWLEAMAAMFQVEGELFSLAGEEHGEAAGHPWLLSLQQDVQLELAGIGALLEEGLEVCRSPGGPGPYASSLEDELALIRYLSSMAEASWSRLHEGFQTAAFGRLKPVKGDSCDKELQEQVKKLRSDAKDKLNKLREELFVRTPQQYFAELARMAPLVKELVRLTEAFARRYSLAKKDKGLLDFTDLEHFCLAILGERAEEGLKPSPAALAYREQFVEIMLDEYQDTNVVQETIVELISRPAPGNRFMVGDVKQSIYRFRLAEPGLFLAKYRRYQTGGGNDADGERIDLAQNFRSRRQVVDAVNDLFRRIMRPAVAEMEYDRNAELVCGAAYPEREPEERGAAEESGLPSGGAAFLGGYTAELVLIDRADGQGTDEAAEEEEAAAYGSYDSGEEGEAPGEPAEDGAEELENAQLEARYIGRRIREITGMSRAAPFPVTDRSGEQRPARFQDIVILLRATSGWASVFLDELAQLGIPAYADINTGYFAATEVETVLSLLQVIDNPRQDIHLAAVLRSPVCGLTAAELAQVRLARREGDYYSALQAWLHQAEEALGESLLPPAAGSGIILPEGVQESAAASEEEQERLVLAWKLLQFRHRLEDWRKESRQGPVSGLISRIYRETGYYDYVGGLPGGVQGQANLRALQDRARQYEATSFRGLFRFLRFIERMRESGSDLGTARALGEQEDVVRVMSIHKSKGLEFPVVFVAGAGKQFNLMDLNGSFLIHKELGFGPKYVDTALRAVYPTLARLAIRRRMRLETLAEEMRVLYVALTRAKEKLVMIGTAAATPSRLASWTRGVKPGMACLPDHALAEARSYLDWIMPAVLGHAGAAAGFLEGMAPQEPARQEDVCPWRLHKVSAAEIARWGTEAKAVNAHKPGEEWMTAVRMLAPLETEASGLGEELSRRLNWAYPGQAASAMLAKTSVSELKRLKAADAPGHDPEAWDWELPLLPILSERRKRDNGASPLYRLPRFRGSRKLTQAEAGIGYHTAMQHMPLGSPPDKVKVRQVLDELKEKGILSGEEHEALDADAIAAFFATDIGERLSCSKQVRRELPFTFGLRAGEVYPHCDEAAAGEMLLVQGVIDCLFEDEDGGLVLVDYKTDRTGGLKQAELKERYRLQLELYGRAVEGIWKRKLKEKIIYYFDGGHVVRI